MIGENPLIPEPWIVRRVRKETRDIRTLELGPSRPETSFLFSPGQFNMLYVFGVGEVPISMSGQPGRSRTLVHTVRGVGAVSCAISRLRPGGVVGVRGPFGSCWPLEQAKGQDVVIVAGGIGLAPLRPAVYALLSARQDYRRILLFYGARTPRDLLFAKELERWRGRLDMTVEVTVDSASSAWRGDVGVVTRFISSSEFETENATALLCGPEVMMRFAVRALQGRGLASEKIYVSMERNMKCAAGFCGRCQFGPTFVCRDGPVFSYAAIRRWFETREI
ncbi:MAG TPA: FAD/NAD(P)-binding protein [Candidatus Acidoferrales bacterium]|nr:FAD/NAD(P)-binding protein [Candidatus Acidoferrales bacterium]